MADSNHVLFSPFFRHYLELIYDEYVLETVQNKAELHVISFCIFSQVFMQRCRVSVSILLMPEMPAR